jgi:tripeptide aminopeptidase
MDLQPLLESSSAALARRRVHELDGRTLDLQVELARIPAPPGGEAERGHEVARLFADLGLAGIRTDGVGNVIAHLSTSAHDAGAAPVLVTAHLDTVFPIETSLEVRRENGRIHVPGIADNARGLAGLLTVADAMVASGVRTQRPVVFVATVGEEGAGDLRGVKHLFRSGSPWRAAAAFLSLDGSGLRRIVHRAVGSKRLRLTLLGPGGHSWSDWGLANPLHAIGAVVASLREIELPEEPRTTLTVARTGGGTSVNAIPEAAWIEMDLRSEGGERLRRLEREVRRRAGEAVASENRRRRRRSSAIRATWETIGDRPGGTIDAATPLVRAAQEVTRLLGVRPELASSSTDANVPIALGIPAVTVGVGGESGGIHTTDEWYSNEGGALGVERALLLVLAAAGLEESASE